MQNLIDQPVSRKSPLICCHGAVASSQNLVSEIGLSILKQGGNAADACVAMAAGLNVTEPCSTGIGGDCFAIYFDAKTKSISGLNGSGRCASNLNLEVLDKLGFNAENPLPITSIHNVTVPGAARGWFDAIERWGDLDLKTVLAPAIKLAEEGFPVAPVTAALWQQGTHKLTASNNPHGSNFLIDGKAPKAGEIFSNPDLANTFKKLAEEGPAGFYEGQVSEAIVELMQSTGGMLSLEDLKNHESTFPDPISVNYHGVDVWEIPPNGQGITALVALNILSGFDLKSMEHNSEEYLHHLIEAMRLAFADTRYFVADMDKVDVPVNGLLSPEYAAERRKLLNANKANLELKHGSPSSYSCTVSFCCIDENGNACSFINSNYAGFGTGLVPRGCGFTLQNRGANFSLDPSHPNCLAPNKRPYHTIIPGLTTKDGQLHSAFSVMGGFMQPQGHVQVIANMVDFGMDPQLSLDAPRFCIEKGEAGGHVLIEEGISDQIIEQLCERGHDARPCKGLKRTVFGRGQIIRRKETQSGRQVLWAGSDLRSDGVAIGY